MAAHHARSSNTPTSTTSPLKAELGRLAGVEDDVKVSAEDSSYTDPGAGSGIRRPAPAWTRLAIAIGTSHGAYQVQARPEAQAPLRYPRRSRQASAGLPHRAARRVLGYPRATLRSINQYGGNMPGAHGRARGYAAQGRQHGRLQDQHRLRPASGLHRRGPPVIWPSIRITSIPVSTSPTRATACARWCVIRSSTSSAATARRDICFRVYLKNPLKLHHGVSSFFQMHPQGPLAALFSYRNLPIRRPLCDVLSFFC